ncbi:MAG: membrane protein insertase YidC, partial [Buchnera aphidicola]|nr:membrane protein insertase YidC [Buchnera aphidicola]
MPVQRNFFIFAFLFVSFLLWQEWSNQLNTSNQNNSIKNTNFHISNSFLKKNQIIITN